MTRSIFRGRVALSFKSNVIKQRMNDIAYYYTDSGKVELILTQGSERFYLWHLHTRHWVVGVVFSGVIELTTKEGIQTLKKEQFFSIPPCHSHSLRIAANSSLLVFCFEHSMDFSMNPIVQGVSLFIPLTEEQQTLLSKGLLPFCLKRGSSNAIAHQPMRTTDFLIEGAIRAVIAKMVDAADVFSGVEHMAAYAGYSKWHFLRSFQKFTGVTPHTFQLLCRLRLLRSLLRNDVESAIAASSVGFSDQSHMHKVFKKYHHMTPGQFKQVNFRLDLK